MAQVTMGGAEYAALVKKADQHDELVEELTTAFTLTKDGYPQVELQVELIMAEQRWPLVVKAIAEDPEFIKRLFEKEFRYLDRTSCKLYNYGYTGTIDLLENEQIEFIWRKLEEGTFDGEETEVLDTDTEQ